MKVGYARISTDDQSLDLQLDALQAANCDKIFSDKASGAKSDRPGLEQALAFLRTGDCLVVWRLDRLGRSVRHLVTTIDGLRDRGVEFVSLQENMDTATAGGRLIFHVFAAIAEFERALIQDRVRAGMAAARARGRRGGQPKSLTEKQIQIGRTLAAAPDSKVEDICATLGVSRSVFYRHIYTPPNHVNKER